MNVLTLDSKKVKMSQPRCERQITSMFTYNEIYSVPEGVIPMKEWIVYALNKDRQREFFGFFYSPSEGEALMEAIIETAENGFIFDSIELNHILHYYVDENRDFKSIMTKEFILTASGKLSKNSRIRSEKKYFENHTQTT